MDAAAMVSAVFTRSNRIEPDVEPPPSMDNDLLARRLRLPAHVLVDVSMAENMPTPGPARGRRRARRATEARGHGDRQPARLGSGGAG